MTRRGVLLAVMTGLLAAAGRRLGRSDPEAGAVLPVQGLAELFTDLEAAAAVGAAYLRTLEGDDPLARLLAGAGVEPQAPLKVRVAQFHERRRQDFLKGETVLIDGWILARSELCACGLLAYSLQVQRGG
jgi:hypothetical protein